MYVNKHPSPPKGRRREERPILSYAIYIEIFKNIAG